MVDDETRHLLGCRLRIPAVAPTTPRISARTIKTSGADGVIEAGRAFTRDRVRTLVAVREVVEP